MAIYLTYLWIGLGCALGGMARHALTRLSIPFSSVLPWGTILTNVLGSFALGLWGPTRWRERGTPPQRTRVFS